MQLAYNLPSLSNEQFEQAKEIKSSIASGNILDKIRAFQQDTQLNNLLNNAKFIEIKNNVLIFAVKDSFTRETLIRNYFLVIKGKAAEIDDSIKMISITVDSGIDNSSLSGDSLVNSNLVSSESDLKRNLEDDIFSKANPKFTFNNYVTGESNIVAYKITKDIALQNIDYNHNNVFYIHSHVGMGKTHLLQSIANEVNNCNENAENKKDTLGSFRKCKVGYLSAERFMHNFVRAVKNNTLFSLRDKIKEVDIFLIDDLQFICGKESTQKEFALILNSLIESGKKIVIASSVPCHMLELNDERTKSILRSSNTIYIEQCDYELRLNILSNYNKNNDIRFEENILKMIADKVTTSVRELEAGLNNLKTYLSISGKKATSDNMCKYIQNYIKSNVKKVTISSIINAVAKYYKISLSDIVSKKRTQKLVTGRQIIAYLAKEMTIESLKIIGKKIGDRDHSTILYYLKKLNGCIKKNDQMVNDIDSIKSSIV
ncbi:DnaA/Hda family protein (plasmid) [Candidatus Bandiella numerosa]|uniref:DnaA ATPase domain-containing protein n=1 Tax=Candidatus Bandiella numerosa TaxID=2570586 RepID=UPI00249E36A2|nr:DnaA/Hda family protein [Candidatus Bandiella numerosa]WHA05708.1 DnaA/Hda family protein [Candidatus Bandiella numerosa]